MSDRRQAWHVIKNLKEFRVSDLHAACGIARSNARDMLQSLERREIVGSRPTTSGRGSGKIYELLWTPASPVPWRESGEQLRVPGWRQQVWNAARMRRRFTLPQALRSLTREAAYDTVYRYAQRLVEAGYLRLATPGKGGTHAIYELAVPHPSPSAPLTPGTGEGRTDG